VNDPAAALPEELGLASPTLAQLYLAQGHVEHARTICKQVLEQDSTNGYALALLERLRPVETARVRVRFVASSATGNELGAGQLEFNWSVPRSLLELPGMLADTRNETRLDVVFAIASLRSGAMQRSGTTRGALEPIATALRYSSVRCLDASGSHRLDAPLGPASAAVMLVLSPGPRLPPTLLSGHTRRPAARVLAVADPVSW
jgi:hypothetical protein